MRLIDADALVLQIKLNFTSAKLGETKAWYTMENVISALRKAPTVDAVPVVRCKDCKYYKVEGGQCPADNTSDRYYSWIPDPNWYCADGERREDK